MLRTLTGVFRGTRWLNDNSVINFILKKIIFPLYLSISGGRINTHDLVLFVRPFDHKGVLTYAHALLHGNIYIEPFEVEVFTAILQINENVVVM